MGSQLQIYQVRTQEYTGDHSCRFIRLELRSTGGSQLQIYQVRTQEYTGDHCCRFIRLELRSTGDYSCQFIRLELRSIQGIIVIDLSGQNSGVHRGSQLQIQQVKTQEYTRDHSCRFRLELRSIQGIIVVVQTSDIMRLFDLTKFIVQNFKFYSTPDVAKMQGIIKSNFVQKMNYFGLNTFTVVHDVYRMLCECSIDKTWKIH